MIAPKDEYISYIMVFVFAAGALLVVGFNLFLSWLVRPKVENKAKRIAYECGEEPIGTAWFQFNIRFYVVALVFIIFDVELALMFPLATIYKRFAAWAGEAQSAATRQLALYFFAEMFFFVLILFAGLVYVWVKGDLSWIRPEMKSRLARYREMARDRVGGDVPPPGG